MKFHAALISRNTVGDGMIELAMIAEKVEKGKRVSGNMNNYENDDSGNGGDNLYEMIVKSPISRRVIVSHQASSRGFLRGSEGKKVGTWHTLIVDSWSKLKPRDFSNTGKRRSKSFGSGR